MRQSCRCLIECGDYIYEDRNIRVEVTIYRGHRIGRDGHFDQSEAYNIVTSVKIRSFDVMSQV